MRDVAAPTSDLVIVRLTSFKARGRQMGSEPGLTNHGREVRRSVSAITN